MFFHKYGNDSLISGYAHAADGCRFKQRYRTAMPRQRQGQVRARDATAGDRNTAFIAQHADTVAPDFMIELPAVQVRSAPGEGLNPVSISRLLPNPRTFSTTKPAASRFLRTQPADV